MQHDDEPPTNPAWQGLMEHLTVGAIRGMAEAHAAMDREGGGPLGPLNDLQMFDAAVVLSAMVLEAIDDRASDASLEEASRHYLSAFRSHLEAFRRVRERRGEPALFAMLERAGVARERRQ